MKRKILAEEKELRKNIRGIYSTLEADSTRDLLLRKITALVSAVREDAIECYHDYLSRPTKFNGVSFEDALRNNMRWRKAAAIREGK